MRPGTARAGVKAKVGCCGTAAPARGRPGAPAGGPPPPPGGPPPPPGGPPGPGGPGGAGGSPPVNVAGLGVPARGDVGPVVPVRAADPRVVTVDMVVT